MWSYNESVKVAIDKFIENHSDIKILLIAEASSFTWGLASPASDHDIKIVYSHEPDWYLSIEENKKDAYVFEFGDVDIVAWDIKKFLRLLKKSNASCFEWISSHIIYFEDEDFKLVRNISKDYFSSRELIYSFTGNSRGHTKNYFSSEELIYSLNSQEQIKNYIREISLNPKKWLHAIRYMLMAIEICETDDLPHYNIDDLLNIKFFDSNKDLRDIVIKLADAKRANIEISLSKEEYDKIKAFLSECQNEARLVASLKESNKADIKPLNDLFIKIIKNY